MVTLPDAASLGARRIPQSQRNIVSFDSGAGKGLEVAGKEIAQFGADATKVADEQSKLVAQATANDLIVNQFAPKASELRAKYYDNQGINASTALPEYQAGLDKLRKETLGASTDPYTQNLMGHFMVSHVTQELDGASRYAVTEKDKYVTGNNNAMLANLSTQAALAYNDPAAVESNRANAHAMIDNQAKATGMIDPATGTSPAVDAAKKKWDGDNAVSMIDTALANNDLTHANLIYNQNKDSMDGDKSLAISKSLDILNKRQDGATTVATLKAGRPIVSGVSPVDVVMKNELAADGSVSVVNDSKGLVIGGINKNSYPKQFAEAKAILDAQGQDASKAYIKNFYQKEIVQKNGVDKLPADVQDVVADGLTNHGAGFQAKLLAAAQGGATRNQLLDMRQAEYDRLAASPNAVKEGWAKSKTGWDNRIKSLRSEAPTAGAPAFKEGVNPMETFKNWQANYPAYSSQIMKISDAGDRKDRLEALDNETNNYKHQSDAFRAGVINDALTLSVDPKFTDMSQMPVDTLKILEEDHPQTIPQIQARADYNKKKSDKFAAHNTETNSPNGYDTIMRTLLPYPEGNRIGSQDHLDKLLGVPDGRGINLKDYEDAKKVLVFGLSDSEKKKISENMKNITNAGGNIDGMGQMRALDWYNQVMDARKHNDSLRDKKLSANAFANTIDNIVGPPLPSRMQQISNAAAQKAQVPTITSWDSSEFKALQSGAPFFDDNGKKRFKK